MSVDRISASLVFRKIIAEGVLDFPSYQAFDLGRSNLLQPGGHVVVHRNNEIEPLKINEPDVLWRVVAGIHVKKFLSVKIAFSVSFLEPG